MRFQEYTRAWVIRVLLGAEFFAAQTIAGEPLRGKTAGMLGAADTAGTVVALTVPLIYRTRLFYIICFVLLALASIGIYFFSVKPFMRHRRTLERRESSRARDAVEQRNRLATINDELNTLLAELQEKTVQLEQAKMKAEEANHAKSEFLATMSHELRTPLNSVIGFTNVLLKNKAKNLHGEDILYLERILANGKDLLTFINEILDLSKIEAGRTEIHVATTSLSALIYDTVAQLGALSLGKDITVCVELPARIEPFRTDGRKLKQILVNLLGNAIKFTEHGSIRVRVAVDAATFMPARIDVVDSGIGIPDEQQQIIFEPFTQGDKTTNRRYGGTGLGLAISRTLADALGYRLNVVSEVGKGSTFSIVLAENAHAYLYANDEQVA